MAATLEEIMVGLADAVGVATDLNVYDAPVDSPLFPAAMVLWPQTIAVDTFFGAAGAFDQSTVTLQILVAAQATAQLDEAHALREALPLVVDAIHDEPSLGFPGVDCRCLTVGEFGRLLFNETIWATTARITVEVLLS